MGTLRARSIVIAAFLIPAIAFGQIGGGGSGIQPRSPDSGMPHGWEAGLAVNPFTTVNLYNGNACTVIHLVTIDPVGPALSFAFIHNSTAAAASGSSGVAPWGFELGKGWRPSYSANIIRDDTNNKATLIEDDGNEWVFTLSSGVYSAPNGRFDILTRTTSPDEFTLVAPDLTVRVFELISSTTTYRLKTITDADGNTLTVAYTTGGKIDYIK